MSGMEAGTYGHISCSTSGMDVRARIVLIISAVGSYACMRRPTSCLAGTSGPTSFSGNLGSNFLPRKTSPALTSASRAIFHFISRGMFREKLHIGPSRARLFAMIMMVIPSRLP